MIILFIILIIISLIILFIQKKNNNLNKEKFTCQKEIDAFMSKKNGPSQACCLASVDHWRTQFVTIREVNKPVPCDVDDRVAHGAGKRWWLSLVRRSEPAPIMARSQWTAPSLAEGTA